MKMSMWSNKKWVSASIVMVILAILLIVWWILPDNGQHDQQISADLGQLQHSVTTYANQHHALPPALEALPMNDAERSRLVHNNYTYTILLENKYQLCATFVAKAIGNTAFDKHPAGKSCFLNFVSITKQSTATNLRVN